MLVGHFRRREHLMFDHNLRANGKSFSRPPQRPRRAKALPGAGPRPQIERLEDRTLLSASNQALVAQMYQDLLQRQSDAAGLANWTRALDQGASPNQVALDLVQSPEGRALQVQTLYQQFLHRAADPPGLANFTQALPGGQTLEDVAAAIVASPEYYQTRGGDTDNGFLNTLYQDALNRPIDSNGAASFGQALTGGMSRTQVAQAIFGSAELKQDIVQHDYQYFLHRAADTAGFANWVQALQHGMRDEQIAAAIVGSQEYTQSAQSTGGSLQQTLLPDNGPTFNALVVNTPSQPVPVQQVGPWMVGGTVNIGNLKNNPVFVDVNNAEQPFQILMDPRGSDGPATFKVPAGERFVIEDISASAAVYSGSRPYFTLSTKIDSQLASQSSPLVHDIPLALAFSDSYAFTDTLVGHETVRIYADPGTTVIAGTQSLFTVYRDSQMTVSGYFVSVS
jgi:hypothetical protein